MAILNYELINYEPTSKNSLVFIHGLMGSIANFKKITQLLEYPSILVDLRNHGNSFHHHQMSYQIMAKDVYQTLNKIDIKNGYTLLGHSLGGKVATMFAEKYQTKTKLNKLIIVDIAPIKYPTHKDYYIELFEELLSIDLNQIPNKGWVVEYLTKKRGARLSQFLTTNLNRTEKGKYYWRINLESIQSNIDKIINYPQINKKIPVETHWISGERSEYLTKKIYNKIKPSFQNSYYYKVNAGHWLHIEQRDNFISIIQNILDS